MKTLRHIVNLASFPGFIAFRERGYYEKLALTRTGIRLQLTSTAEAHPASLHHPPTETGNT